MTSLVSPDLRVVFPELLLAVLAMVLLVLGVAGKKENYRLISCFGVLTLAVVGVANCYFNRGGGRGYGRREDNW